MPSVCSGLEPEARCAPSLLLLASPPQSLQGGAGRVGGVLPPNQPVISKPLPWEKRSCTSSTCLGLPPATLQLSSSEILCLGHAAQEAETSSRTLRIWAHDCMTAAPTLLCSLFSLLTQRASPSLPPTLGKGTRQPAHTPSSFSCGSSPLPLGKNKTQTRNSKTKQ